MKSIETTNMVKKILFSIIIASMFIQGCNYSKKSPDQTIVEGEITDLEKSWIIISEMGPRQTKKIDSVKTDKDGEFKFTLVPEQKSFFNLTFPDRSMITIICGQGDNIRLSAKVDDIEGTYSLTGSKESALLREYFRYTLNNERKVDSLKQIFEQNKNSPEFHIIRGLLEQSFTKIYIDQQKYTRDFINKNPASLASLVALNNQFENNKVLDIREDLELYELVDISMANEYPNNKHYLHLHNSLMEIYEVITQQELAKKYTSIGMTIPSFEIRNIKGNPVWIEEFRGNPLLIYFWAAWDAKSRQTNRRLKSVLDSFYPSEIPVLAISFDNNKEIWKAAIKIDSLNWHHASDLLGMNSPVITLLNIPGKLPYFYLVDEHGQIIFKGKDLSLLSEKISSLRSLN